MECVYDNINIHKNHITIPLSPFFFLDYLEKIQKHFYKSFKVQTDPKVLYNYICNYSYFVLKPLYFDNADEPLSKNFFSVISLTDIISKPYLQEILNFKTQLYTYLLDKGYSCRCMGIKFDSRNIDDFFTVSQRDNGFEYFIAEVLDEASTDTVLRFRSVTRPNVIKLDLNLRFCALYDDDTNTEITRIKVRDIMFLFFNLKSLGRTYNRYLESMIRDVEY